MKRLLLLFMAIILLSGCKGVKAEEVVAQAETFFAKPSWAEEEDVAADVSVPPVEKQDPADIPAYTGMPYVEVNGNSPYFNPEDLITDAFETYSDLDYLGRCGVAYANICPDLMPTEGREEIGEVKPTGWHLVKYDGIEDTFLYNRCHLIGFQLAGENANERNLITGTRYLNVEGMLPFENRIANYVRNTGNHVLYRVTPVFKGENLLCDGVLMEAQSVEDNGLSFCIFCYNVQPGIEIDYATGDSVGPEYTGTEQERRIEEQSEDIPEDVAFVANRNSFKFHLPTCEGALDMAPHNRVYYYGEREELIEAGYEPCKMCNP